MQLWDDPISKKFGSLDLSAHNIIHFTKSSRNISDWISAHAASFCFAAHIMNCSEVNKTCSRHCRHSWKTSTIMYHRRLFSLEHVDDLSSAQDRLHIATVVYTFLNGVVTQFYLELTAFLHGDKAFLMPWTISRLAPFPQPQPPMISEIPLIALMESNRPFRTLETTNFAFSHTAAMATPDFFETDDWTGYMSQFDVRND